MPPTAGIVARPARENLLRALGRRYRRGAHAVKARIFVGGYRPARIEDPGEQVGRHGENGFFHAPSIKCPTPDSFQFS